MRIFPPKERGRPRGKRKILLRGGRCVNVRRYSESTGRPEDLTGAMASARDITGYAPPPYDHKINVWGGAGGGQT